MKSHISYQKTQKFSPLVNDYLGGAENLKPFYNRYPSLENFPNQWSEKSRQRVDRETLVAVLQKQNECLSLSQETKANITALAEENTFTVTTGHQLCLFTGPLYFIYKIISAINLANGLKEKYPDKHFVPIFWMASEDHDFAEINHIHLFGGKHSWQSGQEGAVGRMHLEGLDELLNQLRDILGESVHAQALMALFEEAYLKHETLADASRYLVNALFGKYGLVILDGDDHRLKKQFVSTIKKDVLQQGFCKTIASCSESLAKDYKAQAYVREINFFRLSDGDRKRIEGEVTANEIESKPESMSPNVLLRPLYQETILPNLAYVGGGAELAYWMQLKTAFEQEALPFPILVLRNSALWIESKQLERWRNLGFSELDFFKEEYQLHQDYVNKQTDLSLTKELDGLKGVFADTLAKVSDKSLQASILAEQQRQLNSFEKLGKKLLKSEKKKHEVALQQISKLKADLFPNNTLQERYDSFIPFYLKHGENFVKILQEELNPLEPNFVILGPQ